MILPVHSGHRPVLTLLRKDCFEGVIHSRFHKVINILITHGEEKESILSMVAGTGERFPWSLLLPLDSMDCLEGEAGTHVKSCGSQLFFNGGVIDISLTVAYDTPYFYFEDTDVMEKNLQAARKFLGSTNSNDLKDPFQLCLQEKLSQSKALLRKSIVEEDDQLFMEGCKGLIGLGPGLTPTGDDYLTGIMVVAGLHNSPLRSCAKFHPEILATAYRKTNRLSYEYLKRAMNGQVREKLSNFLRDLMIGGDIMPSLTPLLTVGASSGRDLANGVLLGVELAGLVKKPVFTGSQGKGSEALK